MRLCNLVKNKISLRTNKTNTPFYGAMSFGFAHCPAKRHCWQFFRLLEWKFLIEDAVGEKDVRGKKGGVHECGSGLRIDWRNSHSGGIIL